MFAYGINPPSDAKVSYGCRGIDHGVRVDVPGDRQTYRYETREELTEFINRMNEILTKHVAQFALERVNELERTRSEIVVYCDDELTVKCRRSGGYLHVGAWPTVAESTENDAYPDCEVCGEPIDYCQGHGEIASEM